jgi:hypothetical protein
MPVPSLIGPYVAQLQNRRELRRGHFRNVVVTG